MTFRSQTVFAYNSEEDLREMAKKNSETDITLYSRKNGDLITTFISPAKYPEKISSLTDSLYPADIALITVNSVNRELGEILITLGLMKTRHVILKVDTSVDRSFLERILKDAKIKSYEMTDSSGIELAEKIEKLMMEESGAGVRVVVDQAFKVKSVGTVILGFVLSGTVKKHMDLNVAYSDKVAQVRSIQMQDIDVQEAPAGSRVGLAVKNVDIDELERGTFLTDQDVDYLTELKGELIAVGKLKDNLPESFEVFVADCMRYQRGTYSKGILRMDRKIANLKKEFVLANPNLSPRIIGTFRQA